MPQWQDLVGEMQADLLETRDRSKAGMAKDEGAERGGHHATLDLAAPCWPWNG
jgi:hypothetical protein